MVWRASRVSSSSLFDRADAGSRAKRRLAVQGLVSRRHVRRRARIRDSTTSPSVSADDTLQKRRRRGSRVCSRRRAAHRSLLRTRRTPSLFLGSDWPLRLLTCAPASSRGGGCCSKNDLSLSPSESKSLRRSRLPGRALAASFQTTQGMSCACESRRRRQTQIRRDFGHQRGWSVMRTVHFRSLSMAALAVLTFAASVAAQDRPSGLLNNLEVRQLVARAEPGDQAQLSGHFTALADRYAAEAKRHIVDVSEFHRQSEPQPGHRHERALQATGRSQHAVGDDGA